MNLIDAVVLWRKGEPRRVEGSDWWAAEFTVESWGVNSLSLQVRPTREELLAIKPGDTLQI